ncbi:hypothetical protein VKT23_020387 [Stygiomarasmius scandens]|uniref:Glycoside hydrolase family 5 domain-containing protein n=1 Tax=Marasmiellus scandens TaxID=2682957 RepID=A0ABR1IMV7_9AGAR
MALSFLRVVAAVICAVTLVFADSSFSPAFNYGTDKVRGVNLGGWLVLEPWITPSLFEKTGDERIVDEWTFGQYQDSAVASRALEEHWDTWITEDDFAAIKSAGLNHVRLPIGYWAFDVSAREPYIQGQLPYLEKAIVWAKEHGLKVIVDLHGVPGSQNGFDNSGQRMPYPQWHTDEGNVARTNQVLKKIVAMLSKQSDVVTVIEPLNEPAGFYGEQMMNVTRQYWYDSYGNIRFPYGTSQQGNTLVLLHDAFQDAGAWKGFMPPPEWQGVAMDTHIYQIFSNEEVSRTEQEHIDYACSRASTLESFDLWPIVGEWTPAMTDCAKYLNGRGIGSRYDGTYPGSSFIGPCYGQTGKASTFTQEYKTTLRKFWEAQVIAYEKGGAGWIQWTWKAEDADDWSYQAGLENGWIPKDPTERVYPNICQ